MLDKAVLKSFGIDQKFQVESLLMAILKLKEQKHSTPRDYNEFLVCSGGLFR